jgi:hypothetical protein
MRSRLTPLTAAVLASVGTACVLAVGAAVASVPASSGVISACYDKRTGALRVIHAARKTCRSGEARLTWNQRGVPGSAGPAGPMGPQGIAE